MKKILIPILLAVLGLGAWLGWRHFAPVQNEAALTFYGNVDIREVALSFRVSGRVSELLKDEGDAVQPGELLARLDDAPQRHALAQAEAQAAALAARAEELHRGNRPEEIAQGVANLAASEATLRNAKILLSRRQELRKTQVVAQQDLDDADAACRDAQARRDAAQAALDLLRAGFRAEDIAQGEANLRAAQAAAALARTQLEDTRLLAPEGGTVLTRAAEPGTILAAGSAVFVVSLTQPVRVRAYAEEARLGQVWPGRKVLLFTDSREAPYHGQIGDVSPRAEFTPKTVETADLRTSLVYRFRIVVSDADAGLRQGMPVTVRLAGE